MVLQRVQESNKSSVTGQEPQEAPVEGSSCRGKSLKQASSALDKRSTAEKAAGALATASEAKQPQRAAEAGQVSKQPAEQTDLQRTERASETPAPAVSLEPAAPAEQQAAAMEGVHMPSASQPPRGLPKEPVTGYKVCKSPVRQPRDSKRQPLPDCDDDDPIHCAPAGCCYT